MRFMSSPRAVNITIGTGEARAHLSQHFKAVQTRQHVIEHDQRVFSRQRAVYAGVAIVNCLHLVTIGFKVLGH